MLISPRPIIKCAAARIEAISAVPYAQGGKVTPAFRRSPIPLSLADESSLQHLAFAVFIDDAPARQSGQDRLQEREVSISARLVVEFAYRLRTMQQTADEDAAWDAAADIGRALLEDWSIANGGPDTVLDGVNTQLDNLGRTRLAADTSWLLVQQSYPILFDLEV